MTENASSLDRIIRIIAGFALIAWAFWGKDSFHLLGWLGLVFLGTGAMGFCPLYSVLGISTCPKPKRR